MHKCSEKRAGRRLPYVVLSLLLASSESLNAQESDGCSKFAWSLSQEQALFKAEIPEVRSGAKLDRLPDGAFKLKLAPAEEITWVLAPERPRRTGTSGGVASFPAPAKAGIYQVTLSDDVWLDAIQDGRYARAVGSSGRSDCPGVRKSVRLELRQSPLSIQVSGSSAASIFIAIRSVE